MFLARYLKFKWLQRNETRTLNHLVRKRILNHLAKLAKVQVSLQSSLSPVAVTYSVKCIKDNFENTKTITVTSVSYLPLTSNKYLW